MTQNFIVTYTADFQKAVIISGNDPSKQIPTSEAEATTAPYFHDGKTDGLMFYDQAGAPLVSDAMFARAGYRIRSSLQMVKPIIILRQLLRLN